MVRRHPLETRARIIAAAEDLSCEIGAARVSIESVAARALVSKGGLLYHFPTKHDLLRALVSKHVERMQRAMASRAGCGASPLARSRAYLGVLKDKLDGIASVRDRRAIRPPPSTRRLRPPPA